MSWAWRSPSTRRPLTEVGDELHGEDEAHTRRAGVWDLLAGDDRDRLAEWSERYGRVRAAEGRTAQDSDYYRGLPWRDATGNFVEQWAMRAASFDRFLEMVSHRSGRLVDVGAGNCWAAARCVERGWSAMAIDVNVDGDDGLGAAHHHGVDLTLVRCSLDTIPLEDDSVDVVLINAALQYSADPRVTVGEALRVVGTDGVVVIADSPVFASEESGRRMVEAQDRRLRATGAEPPPVLGRGFIWQPEISDWPGAWIDRTPRRGRL